MKINANYALNAHFNNLTQSLTQCQIFLKSHESDEWYKMLLAWVWWA